METVVAVPSVQPGGLEAPVDAHFGHCGIYTLVTLKDGEVAGVRLLPAVPHQAGGCLAAVQHLAGQGVRALVAGGMGMRPLMGFGQAGIEVFHAGLSASVGQAVSELAAGRLARFGQDRTCQGHGGSCGGHGH